MKRGMALLLSGLWGLLSQAAEPEVSSKAQTEIEQLILESSARITQPGA